jgi:hypothetical protein
MAIRPPDGLPAVGRRARSERQEDVSTKVIDTSASFNSGDTFIPAGGSSAPAVVPAGTTSADLTMSAGPMPNPTQHFDARIFLDRLDGNGFVDVAGLVGSGGTFAPNRDGLSLGSQHFDLRPGMRYYARVSIVGGPIQVHVGLTLN